MHSTEENSIAKVRDLVLKRFRTQSEFGKAIGWSDAKVSYKLKGFGSWSVDDLLLVAKTLGIPRSRYVEYFFTPNPQ